MKKFNKRDQPLYPIIIIHKKRKITPTTKEPTAAQLEQRVKFNVANKFHAHAKEMLPVIICKKKSLDYKTRFTRMIHHCGFTGSYPDYEVDYSQMELTSGSLAGILNGSICHSSRGLTVTWEYERWMGGADDTLNLFVYNSTAKRSYVFGKIALRRQEEMSVEIPGSDQEDVLHVWTFFKSPDHKHVSRSRYFRLERLD